MFNIFKTKEHIANKHVGETRKMGIMEDDYTIAMRREKELAALNSDRKEDTFRDSEGHEMPISQLNGQTEALLRQARAGIRKEMADHKKMAEESLEENEETAQTVKNEIRAEKNKIRFRPTSVWQFFNNHGRTRDGERIGTKLGLYKDYNPKLNEGAPGNRKEAVRQSRRLAEKNKGEQPFEEPDFEDFLPELKDEE